MTAETIMQLPPMPLPFLLISLCILFLCTPLIYLVTVYLPELPIRTLKRLNYLRYEYDTM